MSRICPKCAKTYAGVDRFRCPECNTPFNASEVDLDMSPYIDPEARPTPKPDPTPKPAPARPPEPKLVTPKAAAPTSTPKPSSGKATKTAAPPTPLLSGPASAFVGQTMGIEGFDLGALNIARHSYNIEVLDKSRGWRTLFPVAGTGRTKAFGRNFDARLDVLKTLAIKHLKFDNQRSGLAVIPYDTLNGVFLQIRRPIELRAGIQFRIGNYFLTYQDSTLSQPFEPRVLNEERLVARDLMPLGELRLLRPDGREGLRVPILKDRMIIGRGGTDSQGVVHHADLALPGDMKVSASHAVITWEGSDRDQPFLADLQSDSGTWIRLPAEQPTPLNDQDVLWLGELYLRVARA